MRKTLLAIVLAMLASSGLRAASPTKGQICEERALKETYPVAMRHKCNGDLTKECKRLTDEWLTAAALEKRKCIASASPANARCLSIGDKVTLSGKAFQNTATDYSGDGGRPGQKYIAVLLDKPICYAGDAPGMTETTVQGYQKITAKWIGRHVVITGHVGENEGPSIIVDNVMGR